MERVKTIYGLVDPESPDAYFYIGATVNIRKRLALHLSTARFGNPSSVGHAKTPVMRKVADILSRGQKPLLTVLEESIESESWKRERWWLDKLKEEGHPLVNRDGPRGTGPFREDAKKIAQEVKDKTYWKRHYRGNGPGTRRKRQDNPT